MVDMAIICEGKTERNFAEVLLKPHFANYGIAVSPVEIGVDCLQSGGNVSFERVLHDSRLLLGDYKYVTTLIDFYRLGSGWPVVPQRDGTISSEDRAIAVENAAFNSAKAQLAIEDLEHRLIINVLMHEFEGLLFADPAAIVRVTRAYRAEEALLSIANAYATPEDINTGRDSAPSKRLVTCGANYGKIVHGTRIAAEIGLQAIRAKCPHFDAWMCRVEGLNSSMGAGSME